MCKKQTLYPKKQNKFLETTILLLKQPVFWLYIGILILFIIAIYIAWQESITFFVYNRGGL